MRCADAWMDHADVVERCLVSATVADAFFFLKSFFAVAWDSCHWPVAVLASLVGGCCFGLLGVFVLLCNFQVLSELCENTPA